MTIGLDDSVGNGSRALSSSQAWVSTNTTAPIALTISITPLAV